MPGLFCEDFGVREASLVFVLNCAEYVDFYPAIPRGPSFKLPAVSRLPPRPWSITSPDPPAAPPTLATSRLSLSAASRLWLFTPPDPPALRFAATFLFAYLVGRSLTSPRPAVACTSPRPDAAPTVSYRGLYAYRLHSDR